MKDINLSSNYILIYRILFAGLSWFTIIASAVLYVLAGGSILEWFNRYKSFTWQSNLIVTVWLTLVIIWYNKPESLRKISGLHGALKAAFSQLYGYTSDKDGIRHGLLDETNIDFEEAKFMLVVCSAFINYVKIKITKMGIP